MFGHFAKHIECGGEISALGIVTRVLEMVRRVMEVALGRRGVGRVRIVARG